VTVAEIAGVADAVWRDAIAQIPEGGLEWAGFAPAPRWSAAAVQGDRYPRLGEPDTAVVIGGDGVSLTTPQGAATVRFEDCVAYLTRPDGARLLIGRDGFRVGIEPTLHHRLTADVVAALDARIPQDVVVPLPARRPDDIPQPPVRVRSKPGKPAKPLRWRGYGVWANVLAMVLILLVPFLIVMTIADTVHLGEPSAGGDVTTVSDLILGWSVCAVLTGLLVLLLAGVLRRRKWKRATGEN
jgi:hypothetical protein